MKKLKLYVGCALNNAPQDFIDGILELRRNLALDPRFEVLEFIGKNGTPKDVYRWDIRECVDRADVMLALCDLPSLGLGFEMATHVRMNKRPLLAVAHTGSNVSRLIIGIHGEGSFAFRRYDGLSEIPGILEGWLKEISIL